MHHTTLSYPFVRLHVQRPASICVLCTLRLLNVEHSLTTGHPTSLSPHFTLVIPSNLTAASSEGCPVRSQ